MQTHNITNTYKPLTVFNYYAMKTILALTTSLLIAFSSYGQADSVTISINTANNSMQKKRDDCDLVTLQLKELQKADLQQQTKIVALQVQNQQLTNKFDLIMGHAKAVEKQYKRQKRKKKLFQFLLPVSLIGGFLLGSQ